MVPPAPVAICVAALLATPALAADARHVSAGTAIEYRPTLERSPGEMSLVPRADLRGRIEQPGTYAVDGEGTELDEGLDVDVQLRLGLRFHTAKRLSPWWLMAAVEGDVLTGRLTDAPTLEGEGLPGTGELEHVLRKAMAGVSYGGKVTLMGGVMTSTWGLGLLANDGDRGWEPGSALFTDPRGGDVVLRGMLVVGPLSDWGVRIALAVDDVREDDALLPGDEAQQIVVALSVAPSEDVDAGLYFVLRQQEAADGAETHVVAVDATASRRLDLGEGRTLELGAEGALIAGTTDLGPSVDFPEHDVLQLAAALEARLNLGSWGVALDVAYASGDRNADDQTQNAFKADTNFQQGLVLHRHILAGMSGRAPYTAANPELVGRPAEDLERVPTRGAFSNLLTLFPRLFWRPVSGLELYGGALVAFTPVDLADPFETRLAGGDPRNARGGDPGKYAGIELDIGLRWTTLLGGSELSVGAEAGWFGPGSAFDGEGGDGMLPVWAARGLLRFRL